MAIEDYVAQFGKRGTGNPGGGIGYGLQAQQMRNQNQRYEQQRAQQEQMAKLQEQRDYIRSGVEAIQSVPANQRQFVYQGMMAEAARRGYDVADEPTEWSDEMLPRLMGAAGVAAPQQRGSQTPADLQTHNALLSVLDDPNASEEQKRAARIKLRLDAAPSSAAARTVMMEMADGRKVPFIQFADGSFREFTGSAQQPSAGQPPVAGGQPSPQFVTRTPEEEAAAIEAAKVRARGETQRDLERANPKAMEITSTALRLVNDLLDPNTIDDTKDLFGKGDSIYPDWARGQAETNKLTSLNQLKDILTAENLGIMSGVLSETDLRVIANIAGGGLARGQGDQRAIDELKRLREALGRKASGQKDRTGWQLMIDANGNRAYVGPNGEIEEL